MSSLNSLYLKKEVLEQLLAGMNKKGMAGIEFTISIADESNQYGQNVSGYVAQTKEERDAQKKRFFVGNGKTFWTDGKITIPAKQQPAANANPLLDDDDDFGF